MSALLSDYSGQKLYSEKQYYKWNKGGRGTYCKKHW